MIIISASWRSSPACRSSPLVGVQVVNGVLLPINLFFIWRLPAAASSDGRAPQPRRARRARRAITVFVLSGLSLALVAVTVLGL